MISTRLRGLFLALACLVLLILTVLAGVRIHGNWALRNSLEQYEKEGPVDVRAYAPAEVADPANIAVWLNAGTSIVHLTSGQRVDSLTRLLDVDYKEWNSNDKLQLSEMLKQNDLAIQVLERANHLDDSKFDLHYEEGHEIRLPPYLEFLQVRKLLVCKARLHLAEGELQEAAKTAKMLERMASGLGHESLIISNIVGHVAEKDYYNLIHDLLPSSNPEVLKEFLLQIDHLEKMAVPLSRAIQAEGASLYLTLRSGNLSKILYDNQEETARVRRLYPFLKSQLLASTLHLYRRYTQLSKQPYGSLDEKSWDANEGYLESAIQKAFVPNMGAVVERFQSTESARILAHAAIELCLYAAKNGSYPADLSGMPVLISPYTGEKAAYTVHPDGSAVLAFPNADSFWESRREKLEPAKKPRLTWTLPTPHLFNAN